MSTSIWKLDRSALSPVVWDVATILIVAALACFGSLPSSFARITGPIAVALALLLLAQSYEKDASLKLGRVDLETSWIEKRKRIVLLIRIFAIAFLVLWFSFT